MKFKISLLFLLFAFQNSAANHYQLSSQSKQKVALAAALGGIIGGGLGLASYFGKVRAILKKKEAKSNISKNQTVWNKVKDWVIPGACVIIPAAIGATAAGLLTYYYCPFPERLQEKCEKTLLSYELELQKIELSDIEQLKIAQHSSHFPIVNMIDRLESLQRKLQSIRENLMKVINSGIQPLINAAEIGLEKIKEYEQLLISKAVALSKDPAYLQEWNRKTQERSIYAQNEVAHAHTKLAQATQKNTAALLTPRVVVHEHRHGH